MFEVDFCFGAALCEAFGSKQDKRDVRFSTAKYLDGWLQSTNNLNCGIRFKKIVPQWR